MLRRGLSPLAVTISTPAAAPVLAAVRLRAGRAGSAKGAASMLVEAINTAQAVGAGAEKILVRGDSAYGNGKVIAAVVKTGARFSLTMTKTDPVIAAINTIKDEAYTPVRYPGAVVDPDTGQLISDAQVAEVEHTAFAGTGQQVTARLVVRRVLDANTQDPLFPVWRYHPFLTNSTEPVVQADITHRQHAICETVWSDLIDGPWHTNPPARSPPTPPGPSSPRSATTCSAPPAPWPAPPATPWPAAPPSAPTWSTSPPGWPDPNAGRYCTYPCTWPRATAWLHLWTAVFVT